MPTGCLVFPPEKVDKYTTEKVLSIDVKPGWKAGTKLRYNNEGDELPNGKYQDIVVTIQEKPHSLFKRENNDLHMTIRLSLKEALTGYTKKITTLDARNLNINNMKIIFE